MDKKLFNYYLYQQQMRFLADVIFKFAIILPPVDVVVILDACSWNMYLW